MPADLALSQRTPAVSPEEAAQFLLLLPLVDQALTSADIGPRTSGGVLRIGSGKRPRWTPTRISEPESFVLRHDWEISLAGRIHKVLCELELTFLEAQVLHHHFWKAIPLRTLADFLDVRTDQLREARESLLAKVTAAMGPLEREIVVNRRRGA